MKTIKSDIKAFNISGGKSSRIGSNKALLKVEDKTLIQRAVDLLNPIFPKVVISSNEPELYESVGKIIIKDIYPGWGPLSEIHSSLNSTSTEKNFFISCEMPFINKELINYLIDHKSDKDIILPKADGRIQQLCGIYSRKIFQTVDKLIIESMQENSTLKGSIYDLLALVEAEIADVTELNFYHPDLFFNVNTPEEYNYAKRVLEGNRD